MFSAYLEFDEWRAIAKATVEVCRACGTPVMLGITSTYTLGAQRRSEYAVQLGADAVQLALPYWLEVKDHEVVRFFQEVTDAFPRQEGSPDRSTSLCDRPMTREKWTDDGAES